MSTCTLEYNIDGIKGHLNILKVHFQYYNSNALLKIALCYKAKLSLMSI